MAAAAHARAEQSQIRCHERRAGEQIKRGRLDQFADQPPAAEKPTPKRDGARAERGPAAAIPPPRAAAERSAEPPPPRPPPTPPSPRATTPRRPSGAARSAPTAPSTESGRDRAATSDPCRRPRRA